MNTEKTSLENENQPSCLGDVISRFRSDSKTVEITETELRGLIFWATAGIEKSNGGSYHSVVEFIKYNYKFMTYQKSRYKKLVFGSRLKNGL